MLDETYKRNLVRQWAATLSTPYVDTINQAPASAPAEPWFTIQFDAEAAELINYAGGLSERGLIDLIFAGPPGVGDGALLATVQTDVAAFLGNVDPNRRLTLEFAHAPFEQTGGSADHSYRIMVGIEYTYRT